MLTKKQELAIEYHLQGLDKTNAVFKAFECKNKQTASSIATKLFKRKDVQDRLSERLEKRDEIIDLDFATLVKKSIPLQTVVDTLKAQMESEDKRVVDSALDKYIKIIGGYKDNQGKVIGLFEKIKTIKE